MADSYSALVNSQYEFDLSEIDLNTIDVTATGENSFHLIYRNRSIKVKIHSADFPTGEYLVEINGQNYEVSLETPLDLFIKKMGFASREGNLVDKIMAPMPGLLLDIYVKEGQEVEKDEPLLVLEAMKMENVILSPRKGVIDGIVQEKGKTVDKGTELITFR